METILEPWQQLKSTAKSTNTFTNCCLVRNGKEDETYAQKINKDKDVNSAHYFKLRIPVGLLLRTKYVEEHGDAWP